MQAVARWGHHDGTVGLQFTLLAVVFHLERSQRRDGDASALHELFTDNLGQFDLERFVHIRAVSQPQHKFATDAPYILSIADSRFRGGLDLSHRIRPVRLP